MLPLGCTDRFLSLVSLPLLLHFKIKIFGQSLVPQVFLGSLGQSFAHLLASKDGHLESCISEFSKFSAASAASAWMISPLPVTQCSETLGAWHRMRSDFDGAFGAPEVFPFPRGSLVYKMEQ